MSLPKVVTEIAQLREVRRSLTGTVGVVPTMGALHEGHASLLRHLRNRCDHSVLTLFVNPTQFGPTEDLARYPRTFEKDLEIAAAAGVDLVFAPQAAEIYPEGYSTYVEEFSLSQPFCGQTRPGHFRGVTTVVLKLFNLIQPHISLFGLKDAQQFFVLSKMVADLNLETQVIGVPTVRETDGLALSSRNTYLSAESRKIAPRFYQALCQIRDRLAQNSSEDVDLVLSNAKASLSHQGFNVQYLDCVDLPKFRLAQGVLSSDRAYLIAGAVLLDKTRLIDNFILNQSKLPGLHFID